MRINLTELFSVDGKEKSYKVNIEMDSFQAFGDTCKVISKEPVTLHIQNVGGGKLLMEGKTFITLSIPCSRCLEPVDVPVELEISQELDIRQAGEEDTALCRWLLSGCRPVDRQRAAAEFAHEGFV